MPPIPPTPIPPIKLNTIWDVCKVIIFVMVWYITTDANRALVAAVDYMKLVEPLGHGIAILPQASWLGAQVGFIQGAIMAAQTLVTIWAGPTVFTYLGPVLMSAFRAPINLVLEFRRAWNAKPRKKDGDDGDDDSDNPDDNKDPGSEDPKKDNPQA